MKNLAENTEVPGLKNEKLGDIVETNSSETASIAEKGELKFGDDVSGATEQLKTSGKSWMSKMRGWFDKGVDRVIAGSNKFVNEGYGADDVKAVFNKGKEFVQSLPDRAKNLDERGFGDGTKLYDAVKSGQEAINSFINNPKEAFRKLNFREQKAEKKNEIIAERAELSKFTDDLSKEKNKGGLEKAKSGIFNQFKKVKEWGDNAVAWAMYGGKEERDMYRQTLLKYKMDGLAEKARREHGEHGQYQSTYKKYDIFQTFAAEMEKAHHGNRGHEAAHGGHHGGH